MKLGKHDSAERCPEVLIVLLGIETRLSLLSAENVFVLIVLLGIETIEDTGKASGEGVLIVLLGIETRPLQARRRHLRAVLIVLLGIETDD